MKIGVISDTHQLSLSKELRVFIERLSQEVDLIIHAGDITGIDFIIELKELLKDKLVIVSGNMDTSGVVNSVKDHEVVEAEGINIGVTHSWGSPFECAENAFNFFKNKKIDTDIIIFGHSHHPYNRIKDNILMFNPGSIIDQEYAPYTSYGIIEVENNKILKHEIIPFSI